MPIDTKQYVASTKISKNQEGEWVVTARDEDKKLMPECYYFTDDKEDAMGTANLMTQKWYAARWVNALESGEYAQGMGRLERDSKYCCLGVACKIFSTELEIATRDFTVKGCGTEVLYDENKDYAPESLGEILGFDEHDTLKGYTLLVRYEGRLIAVDELNDNHALGFDVIAEVIKGHYKL